MPDVSGRHMGWCFVGRRWKSSVQPDLGQSEITPGTAGMGSEAAPCYWSLKKEIPCMKKKALPSECSLNFVSQIWALSSWRFPEHPQWGEQMLWHLLRQVVWNRSSVSCLFLCTPLTLCALGEKFSRWRYFRPCSVLKNSLLKMFCGYLCLTCPLGQVKEQQLFHVGLPRRALAMALLCFPIWYREIHCRHLHPGFLFVQIKNNL